MSRAGSVLFKDLDFVISPGERVALVGPNGVGKTTLLDIAIGDIQPNTGSVFTGPDESIGYLRQERLLQGTVGDHLGKATGEAHELRKQLTSLEHAMADDPANEQVIARYGAVQERYSDIQGWESESRMMATCDRLGIAEISLQTPLQGLSGGQLARVMMAALVLQTPTMLLLDEPTNHLDRDGARWLSSYLHEFGGTLFVVSHDRQFLQDTVDRIVELDGIHDGIQSYDGSYGYFREEKRRRWERAVSDYEAQQKTEKRLKEDIARTKEQARSVERSTHSSSTRRYAKKVAKKAKSREHRLDRDMNSAGRIAEPEEYSSIDLRLAGRSTKGQLLVRIEEATACYQGRSVLHDVDLRIWGRDRIIVTGANGSGKTTLLRLILGQLEPSSGQVTTYTEVGYLPQANHDLPLDEHVLTFFRDGLSLYEYEARRYLGHFLFTQEQLQNPLRNLSAGETRRLLLAKLMNSSADLLILDEPTNFLDFDSMDVVEHNLSGYAGTLLIVSHDEHLARNINSDRFWHVADGVVRESVDL